MNKIVKNYLYNIISLVSGSLIPIIIFPYVSRVLKPEYLGKVSFAQSISNYFITIALLGTPIYGIRELSKVNKKDKEFIKKFSELFIISFIMSIISFCIFVIISYFNKNLFTILNLLIIFSLPVLFSFMNLDYLFITLEKHKRRTIRTVFLKILSLFLIFIFIKTEEDYLKYATIIVVPEILIRIFDLYSCKTYITLKQLEFKYHLKSLLIIFLYLFSVSIYLNLDTTMIGIFKNEIEVGYYITGVKIVKMIIPLLSVLGTVMAPQIIKKIHEKNEIKVYEMMDNFIDFNLLLGIPIMFLMVLLSKEIIFVLAGERFLNSINTMKIISLIIIFIPIGTFLGGQILLPNNREKIVFKIAIIGMIGNIIFNVLFIPKYGIEGASIATVITEFSIFIYRGKKVKEIYKNYKFITKERKNYLIVGILVFIINYLIHNFYKCKVEILEIILISFIYLTCYFLILILLKDKNIKKCFMIKIKK